jgi:hypothetical protein
MERVVAVGGMSAIAFLFMKFNRCSTKLLIREVLKNIKLLIFQLAICQRQQRHHL